MSVAVAPNSVFAADFVVQCLLGEGGMGAVYVVEQRSTGKLRALKLMHPQFLQDSTSRERFAQEARIGGRIESDHIVQVIAAGVDSDTGYPYLVMELLQGEDLADTVDRRGALPPEEVREIFAQLGHALVAAHTAGVVHRDLKPENIFLATPRQEGISVFVKILDFGISKLVAEAQAQVTAPLGTPLWMAPEQTESRLPLGPYTDVWALGLIAFRALTGRHYWMAGNTEQATASAVLREILVDPLPPASVRAAELGVADKLPPGFDAWFSRCVCREASGRFPSADPVRVAFAEMMRGFAAVSGPRLGPGSAPLLGAETPNFGPKPSTPPPGRRLIRGLRPPPPPPRKDSGAGGAALGPAGTLAVPIQSGPGVLESSSGATNGLSASIGRVPVAPPRTGEALGATPSGVVSRTWGRRAVPFGVAAAALFVVVLGSAGLVRSLTRSSPVGSGGTDSQGALGARLRAKALEASAPQTAAELYKETCAGGDGPSCTLLGALYERGVGVVRDRTRAVAFYERGCSARDPLGCAYEAVLLAAGRGIKADPKQAAALASAAKPGLINACAQGGTRECVALATLLTLALGTTSDDSRAAELNQLACDAGNLAGCANLGMLSVIGTGIFRDVRRGGELLKKACDGGETGACTGLGVLKSKATFVTRVSARGVFVFKVACQGGFRVGCAGWGKTYDVPRDVASDYSGAVSLTSRACDAGETVACVNLGAFHLYGVGTARNPAAAADLFRKACNEGNAGGCGELGMLVSQGKGVPYDGPRARDLLTQACDWGEPDACVMLGSFYVNGVGSPKDPARGFLTFKKYCEEQRLAKACTAYGESLATGLSGPKNPGLALEVLKPFCEGQGVQLYPQACAATGHVFETAGGRLTDLALAARFYQEACDRGDYAGCVQLSRLYLNGLGVPRDNQKALSLVQGGCTANDTDSCATLGSYTAFGKAGLSANGAEALPLLQRACDDGQWESCATLGLVHLWGMGGLARSKEKAKSALELACSHDNLLGCKAIRDNGL